MRNSPLTAREIKMFYETAPEGLSKSLALIFICCGIHPGCIQDWSPKKYNLRYDDQYISWKRTKTKNKVMIPIRYPLRENNRIKDLAYWKGKSRQHMTNRIGEIFSSLNMRGVTPLTLRRTYFCNHGRLSHSQMLVCAESGTSWNTIVNHYALGASEVGMITKDELEFLRLMYEYSKVPGGE